MSAIKKEDKNVNYGGRAILSDSIKSHGDDPFFVKKVEEAKIAVRKLDLSKIKQN